MNKEDLKETKIYLSNIEDRIKFQEKMFSLGIKWYSSTESLSYLDSPFYFIDWDLRLSHGSKGDYLGFRYSDHKQVFLNDVLAIKEPNKVCKSNPFDIINDIIKHYEIDKENSTFECIKLKPIRDINTTEDLIETGGRITGYWINDDAELCKSYNLCYSENSNNVFFSEKEAKSALAMAQISQLMPYYGGAITTEEWNTPDTTKFTIERVKDGILKGTSATAYYHIAFHTEEQRDSFLKNNYRLVKDYLMLD